MLACEIMFIFLLGLEKGFVMSKVSSGWRSGSMFVLKFMLANEGLHCQLCWNAVKWSVGLYLGDQKLISSIQGIQIMVVVGSI